MTFVINSRASAIGTEPSIEQKNMVYAQHEIADAWFLRYIKINKKRDIFGAELIEKVHKRYLAENEKLKALWNEYIGYCY